jgi:translocation and assembly module TamB
MAIAYPSLDAITDNPEQVGLDIDIRNSYIGLQDVQYFAPDLLENPSFKSIANSTVRVNAQANGQLDNVRVQQLQLNGLQGTNVNVNGNVRNAMDPDNLYLDLNIGRFATTRTDIMALTPPGTIPPDFRIPGQVSMTGNYKGSLTAFDATADVRTSFGNVNAVVDMGANESFTATVRSGSFDLEQLFTDSLGLGTIALDAKASGTGLTPETMRADVQAQVRRFDYNNYTYNDIDLKACAGGGVRRFAVDDGREGFVQVDELHNTVPFGGSSFIGRNHCSEIRPIQHTYIYIYFGLCQISGNGRVSGYIYRAVEQVIVLQR